MNISIDKSALGVSASRKLSEIMNNGQLSILDSLECIHGSRMDLGDITVRFVDSEIITENEEVYIDGEELLPELDEITDRERTYRLFDTDNGFLILTSEKSLPFLGVDIHQAIIDIIVRNSMYIGNEDDVGLMSLESLVLTYVKAYTASFPVSLATELFNSEQIVTGVLDCMRELNKQLIPDLYGKYSYFVYLMRLSAYSRVFYDKGAMIVIATKDKSPTVLECLDKIQADLNIVKPYIYNWLDKWLSGKELDNVDANSAKLLYKMITDKWNRGVEKV